LVLEASLCKRVERQEEQAKDLMRLLKLLQAQSETQKDENADLRDQLKVLTYRVKELEAAKAPAFSVSEKIHEIKQEFAQDLKALGKELAVDIVSLNEKIDKKHQIVNEAVKNLQLNLHKLMKSSRKSEGLTLDKVKKAAVDSTQELHKNYESLQKRIQILSKEVYGNITSIRKNSRKNSRRSSLVVSSASQLTNYQSKNALARSSIQDSDPIFNQKQNEILQRIMFLERDLDNMKSTAGF